MNKNNYIICFVMLISSFFDSCEETNARRPVSVRSSSNMVESIKFNKNLLKYEEKKIEEVIAKGSMIGFKKSSNGFIYRYVKRHSKAESISEGDRVSISFDLRTIDGKVIYSKIDNGIRSFNYNKELVLFTGLRQALGLMRERDTLQAFFPSSIAYGYHGDEDKIESNVPIFSEIILLNVTKINK